jgi:hypothetical protein
MKTSVAEQAADSLAEALALGIQRQLAEGAGEDAEGRRYLLHDLNHLLDRLGVGPGGELTPQLLRRPSHLLPHLRASLEIPVQALVKALPHRLDSFLKSDRKDPSWPDQARWLLEQVARKASQ